MPVKFGVDPVLSLKAPERIPAHWVIILDFLLPLVEQIVSFLYSLSVLFPLVSNFRL